MFEAYIGLLLLCLCVYLINRKKLPSYFIYLGWLIVAVLLTEVVSRYIDSIGINTNPLDHLYQLLEIWLLSLAYYHVLKNKKIRKIIITVLVLVSIVYPVSSFFLEGIYNDCILSYLLNGILIISLSLVFFQELYNDENPEMNILSHGFFWINCGNLIYYSGSFFQMGLNTYIRDFNPELAAQLKSIGHVLNYFLYATYLIGFLCIKKQKS